MAGADSESSIQDSIERSAQVSRLIFKAPPTLITYAAALVLSGLLGLFLEPSPRGAAVGLVLVGVPAVVAGLASAPLANLLGGSLYYKRSAFLALVAEGVVGVAAVLSGPLAVAFGVPQVWTLAFGYMWATSARHGVLFAISDSRHTRNLPVSLLQAAVALPLLHAVYGFGTREWLLVALLPVVFLLPLVFFLNLFDAPLKRNFHASASELFRAYLDHLTTGSFDAEDVIGRWAEEIRAKFGVVGFQRMDGTVKAAMVVPVLHPGPIGRLGGGDLPGKVAEALGDVAGFVMVPHGPATHDYNPVSSAEVDRFARAVRGVVEGLEYEEGGSPAVVGAEPPDGEVGAEGVRVVSQRFGGGALLTYTSWPEPIDDVEYGVGLAAELSARLAGAREAVFVDCHNSLRPGAGAVFLCTPRADAILRHAREATAEAGQGMVDAVGVGVAQDSVTFGHDDGVGDQGVQALVVEAGGQRHAYVLWDGNNMLPEVTHRIGEELEDVVDTFQVMTTDNHSVNAVAGSYSPVGHLADPGAIARCTRAAVVAALEDVEPVRSAVSTGVVEDLRVFGHQKTIMLTTSINTMTSIVVEMVAATAVVQALGAALLFHVVRGF